MNNFNSTLLVIILFIFCNNLQGQDFKKLQKNLASSKTTEAKSSVLLDLGDYFLDKNSDSTKYYLESASKLIKQNQSDSLQFKRDLLIAKIKINEEKHSEAIKLSKILQQKSRNNKNKEPYLKAVYVQLYSYAKQEKSQVIIDSILPLIKNIKPYNSKTLGELYLSIGIQYSLVNNLNEALTFYEKALPIFTKLNYKRGLHDCYKRIGYNFYKTDNYDEALNYANKAEIIANEVKDQNLLLSDYGLLGSIYYYKEEYKKAINYFEKILKSKNTNKKSINSLAYRYYLDSYLALEDYDKVVEFAKKELQSNYVDSYQKYILYYKILTAYNRNQKWDKSVEYVKKTNGLLETEEIPFFKLIDTLDFYEQTYTAYAGYKDYKNAYEYLNKYKILDAKKLDEINYQTTIENQTKFNVKDKQIEIQNLELQNKEERLKVLETEQHRNILAIILLFFIIFSILFIYFFRKLKKKNNQISILLKELHHRTKNNLQLITSLLRLQSKNNSNFNIDEFLEINQNRINSIALVHQNLYLNEVTSGNVILNKYVQELTDSIQNLFQKDRGYIKFNIETNDCFLNINTTISLGLIINELVTNTIKYAFPNNENGEISISIKSLANKKYELIYKDNGIGFNKENINQKSFGIELINLLVSQLNGTINFENNYGSMYKIIFSENI